MSNRVKYFEEFTVGASFEGSYRRTMTEAELVATVALSGLRFPLFSDAEWCKENIPGGERRFPGFVGLGIANAMCEEHVGHGNLGVRVIENVKFHGSIKPGDTIHARAEVMRVDPGSDPAKGLVVMNVRLYNQRDERMLEFLPVFTMKKRPK